MTKTWILASGSPRRAKLLAEHNIPFTVLKTDAPEVTLPHDPVETVRTNARAKLDAACRTLHFPPVPTGTAGVLAADTIVWFDGRIYGKPRDEAEAAAFLRTLSDQTHQVYTGLAQMDNAGVIHTAVVRSDVTFHTLTHATIAAYIDRVHPLDRAGAYDIDESGDLIVAGYTGSYENIMGLPVDALPCV